MRPRSGANSPLPCQGEAESLAESKEATPAASDSLPELLKEAPRSTTGLKLIGDEAPPTLPWRYVLKDETRRSFVGFLPSTLSRLAGPGRAWRGLVAEVKRCAARSSPKPWKALASRWFVLRQGQTGYNQLDPMDLFRARPRGWSTLIALVHTAPLAAAQS